VKNVELGHQGKECSFEAILKKYQLTGDPALVLLGKIVNGAVTQPPVTMGPVTTAVFEDTCGNLLQIAQRHSP
jgi:hypothetical protein